jgi:hypothetical protein
MSNVIPFRRCKCGSAAKEAELCFGEDAIGAFFACDDCLNKTAAEIESVKPVFDAMIAVGVSREHANETMIFMMGLHKP